MDNNYLPKEITVKEYNGYWAKQYETANIFINRIEQSIFNTTLDGQVRRHFTCSGWGPDTQEYIINALDYYHKEVVRKLIKEPTPKSYKVKPRKVIKWK